MTAGVHGDCWIPPTADQIAERSASLGLNLSAERMALSGRLGPGFAGAHERVARWWREAREPVPDIEWRPGNDPWNATEVELPAHPAPAGPLAGLTVAVKSSIAIAGVPLAAGSLLVEGHVPVESATVVRRAVDAGAVVTHTGRTDNLCLAITGDQGAHGPVLNPWSAAHTTWGSSAGAAALTSAGWVDAAIMVDQAGSGRVPGAGCGLVVFLPTRGLIPTTGVLGFTTVQDRVAVGARDTRTVARLASRLSGGDGRDLKQGPHAAPVDWATALGDDISGLRVGLVRESFTPDRCDPHVAEVLLSFLDRLARLGCEVREVTIPRYDDAVDLAMLITVHAGVPAMFSTGLGSDSGVLRGDPEMVEHVAGRFARHPEWLAETVQVSAAAAGHDGGRPRGYWLAMAMQMVPQLTAAYQEPLRARNPVDVLVTPTVHATPPALLPPEASREQVLTRALGPGIRHTCAINLTGQPAAQIPAGLVDGLPVGVQVVALPRRDALCLRVAAVLEPAGGFPGAPAAPPGPAHL